MSFFNAIARILFFDYLPEITNDRTTTVCVRAGVCVCVCLQADQAVMWRKAHIRYMSEGWREQQPAAGHISIISIFNNFNPLQSIKSKRAYFSPEFGLGGVCMCRPFQLGCLVPATTTT